MKAKMSSGGNGVSANGQRSEATAPSVASEVDERANVSGQVDVTEDHGYKYEYTQDGNEDDDDEEEDESMANIGGAEQKRRPPTLPLNGPTVVMTEAHDRIPYVHMLGKNYHPIHDFHSRKGYETSLFWFTYRWNFPEIVPYQITTDAGWGCMLRSAQMLLAHTLRLHFKTKHWKPQIKAPKARDDPFVRSLLTWFADFPSKRDCVYSLHNMVACGFARYETLPGEWYGPAKACYVLRDLVDLHQQTQPSLFRVHVSSEGTVYRHSVHSLMTRDSKQEAINRWKLQPQKEMPSHPLDPSKETPPSAQGPDEFQWDTGLLLLVPLRLGLEKFNEDYIKTIAWSFCIPQSVGILGGRPRGARWFYGAYADGSKVLGLDPHTVQDAPARVATDTPDSIPFGKSLDTEVDLSNEYLESVHTAYPEVFQLNHMDPSIAMGFYCRDKSEFLELQQHIRQLNEHFRSLPDLFTFADYAPDYGMSVAAPDTTLGDLDYDEKAEPEVADSDEEDYVLL